MDALKQLAGNSGYHFQLLTSVIEVNELQKRRVIGKLHKHLGGLVGKRVALFGLAFKPNTDDMREASSLVLSVMPELDCVQRVQDVLRDADAVVLVTEWPEFMELDWALVAETMRGSLVIDGRNALDQGLIRSAGLVYEGIGRGPA